MRALLVVLAFAAAPGNSEIPALIRQLGADTRAEREEATAKLEQIGPPALRQLRQALTSKDAEVRRRARRLLDRIEKNTFHEVRVFNAEAGSVNGVAFSPDGKRGYSCDSRAVRLWDLATGRELARAEDHRDRVMCVAVSPDGKLIASGSEDRTVRIADATKLTEVHVLKQHTSTVRCVQFSSDGKRLLSTGFDARVQEWDVSAGKQLRWTWVNGRCYSLALLGDSRRIVGACNDAALIMDLEGARFVGQLSGHTKLTSALSLSGEGSRLLTGSHDTTLRLWDLKTRKCLQVLKGHTDVVSAVALSPDGQWAVSGGHDKFLRIWDLEAGRHVRELRGHEKAIWSVAFSPDGKHALSGSHDGTMRLWKVAP